MKLYVYDHCPFCVRARMAFALKGIPYTMAVLANDDEETPIKMIGTKMLPILEDADGFMGESLDIVHKVDAMTGEPLFDRQPSAALESWIETWRPLIMKLSLPRAADPIYAEFATENARNYYIKKKQDTFGPFDEMLAQTADFIAELEPAWQELEAILPDAENASIDDILLFPLLRRLTDVEGLTFPAPVAAYVQRMAERTNVPLIPDMRKAA